MRNIIRHNQNPVKLLIKKILACDSSQVLSEATKALKLLSSSSLAIDILMKENSLLGIIRTKFVDSDCLSQQNILEIVSLTCKYQKYRSELVNHEDFIETLMSQVKSISIKITYWTIRIFRQLAKDEASLEKLQGDKLRLSHKLIYAFKWLDCKNIPENNVSNQEELKEEADKVMELKES